NRVVTDRCYHPMTLTRKPFAEFAAELAAGLRAGRGDEPIAESARFKVIEVSPGGLALADDFRPRGRGHRGRELPYPRGGGGGNRRPCRSPGPRATPRPSRSSSPCRARRSCSIVRGASPHARNHSVTVFMLLFHDIVRPVILSG